MAILEYVDRVGELRPARAVTKEGGATAAVAPSSLSLEERLAQVMKTQATLRAAAKDGAHLAPLTPSFPHPHVAPSKWDDSLWAPRSKKARASILSGGVLFPHRASGKAKAEGGKGKAIELR